MQHKERERRRRCQTFRKFAEADTAGASHCQQNPAIYREVMKKTVLLFALIIAMLLPGCGSYDEAYNAGYALGQKAVQGEKDGQKSNSPSKLTIQAGKWLGEGLVIGIKQMGNKVYSAGSNLGSDATKSISSAISQISDVVDSDMDVQPTIRPVLDLSDIKSRAGSISSILGAGSSIGLMTNVKSIGSVMNGRSQNGANSDVVSAIDKLRGELGNVGGTSYNINGITYDDGSNISDAVKVLVRAAKIGKRV